MSQFNPVDASRRGLEIRKARAALKAEISEGAHSLLGLYDEAGEPDAPAVLAGLRVEWFLRAIPGIGVGKARRLLDTHGISPRATMGGLRVRQRAALRVSVQQLHRQHGAKHRGILLVLVGPTAVGKGTIVRWILEQYPNFVLSVSATTRPSRPGEREGVDYYFVSEREFDALVSQKGLLEWARVHKKHRYGTPREPVEVMLDQRRNVILEIDIQGARQVKRKIPGALCVFIAPPSFEELERRLDARGTENFRERRRRLATAKQEMAAQGECDAVVVNEVVSDAAQLVVDLVLASTSSAQSKE